MKFSCFYFLIATIVFSSCHRDTSNAAAIINMMNRHPDIYKPEDIKQYTLTRLIYNEVDSTKIALYKTKTDNQSIVVFSNGDNVSYAIPFPDNEYRKYWAFFSDHKDKSDANTFSDELHSAVKTLAVSNNRKAYGLLGDMLESLIGSRPIDHDDTTSIKTFANNREITDSCTTMQARNYTELLKLAKIDGTHWWNYNAYHDAANNRIYQIDIKENLQKGNFYFGVHVYREPCVFKPLIM